MRVIIPINNKYRIESDQYSWNITQRADYKDGKTEKIQEYWKPIAFLKTLEQAIKNLYGLQIRTIDASDAILILGQMKKVQENMEKSLKPFNIEIKGSLQSPETNDK